MEPLLPRVRSCDHRITFPEGTEHKSHKRVNLLRISQTFNTADTLKAGTGSSTLGQHLSRYITVSVPCISPRGSGDILVQLLIQQLFYQAALCVCAYAFVSMHVC